MRFDKRIKEGVNSCSLPSLVNPGYSSMACNITIGGQRGEGGVKLTCFPAGFIYLSLHFYAINLFLLNI